MDDDTAQTKTPDDHLTSQALTTVPDLLSPVLNRFWTVLGAAFLVAVLFVALSFYIEPTYRTSTTIAPISNGAMINVGGNSALGQVSRLLDVGGFGQGDFTRDAQGVLRSDALISRFISDREILNQVTRFDPESDERPPELAEAVRSFKNSILRIDEDKFSGLTTVSIDWHDPAIAVEWTNGFVRLANDIIRERAIENATRGNEFLQRELEQNSSVELRQAIYGLMENNIKMTMLATTRQELAFTIIDPAVMPPEDDYVWPNRLLLALLGAVLGGGSSIAIVLALHLRRERKIRAE